MMTTCVLGAALFPYFRDFCQLDNSHCSMAVLFSFFLFLFFLALLLFLYAEADYNWQQC